MQKGEQKDNQEITRVVVKELTEDKVKRWWKCLTIHGYPLFLSAF